MKAELTYSIKIYEENGDVAMPVEPQKSLIVGIPDLTERSNDVIKVAAGADDVEYNFGLVNSATLLFIKTDNTISIKKNTDTGEVWTIAADKITGDTKYGFLFMTTSSVTKLFISNAGSDTANVQIIIAS